MQKMLNEALQRIKSPVPEHMSFAEYYNQIWGTDALMQVPIYGYFQFKSVLMALENREDLETVLMDMGIHKKIGKQDLANKNYSISADTAKLVLYDIRHLLDGLGIAQPLTDVQLVDDPFIQCANPVPSSD